MLPNIGVLMSGQSGLSVESLVSVTSLVNFVAMQPRYYFGLFVGQKLTTVTSLTLVTRLVLGQILYLMLLE